jgi:hypothetical protein
VSTTTVPVLDWIGLDWIGWFTMRFDSSVPLPSDTIDLFYSHLERFYLPSCRINDIFYSNTISYE